MIKRNPKLRLIWWSVLTFIADVSVIIGLFTGTLNGLHVSGATLMSIALIYLVASYKIDGPSSLKQEQTDERIKTLAAKAGSNAFTILFLITWLLAFLIDRPEFTLLKENISLVLAAMAITGLITQLTSFVWYKYRV